MKRTSATRQTLPARVQLDKWSRAVSPHLERRWLNITQWIVHYYFISRFTFDKSHTWWNSDVRSYNPVNFGVVTSKPTKIIMMLTATNRSTPAERRWFGGSISATPATPNVIPMNRSKCEPSRIIPIYPQIRKLIDERSNVVNACLRPSGSRKNICWSDFMFVGELLKS